MPKRFQGAIFDVDGVLVDSPHEKAWRESLRELMENDWSDIRDQTTWSPEAFTSRVYEEQMSGKPRMDGARAALEYFHVPDDDDHRLAQYADRKQAMVVRLIEAGDFTAYPDALRFIIHVKDAGIRTAAASSSKNAKLFLSQIRLDTFAEENGITSPSVRPGLTLLDYFDADVSGRDFAHGKPHPDMFLAAAQGARDRARGLDGDGGRRRRGAGRQGRAHGSDRHRPCRRRGAPGRGTRRHRGHEPRRRGSRGVARWPSGRQARVAERRCASRRVTGLGSLACSSIQRPPRAHPRTRT